MYHIAICDDEKSFITELDNLIQRYAQETGHAFKVTAYFDGAELLRNYPVDADLIFLDIQMAQVDGLKTAEAIRKIDSGVSIIFLTSMSQYALEGYKYGATNFIIKPIKYIRLKDELDRWLVVHRQKDNRYVLVENDTGKCKVLLNTLQYIETFGRNLMVHTEGENIVAYRSMKEFEAELPGSSFVRCHTGYIVNLFFIRRVEKLDIELTTGERIPISQPKRKIVMERLAEYWGSRL